VGAPRVAHGFGKLEDHIDFFYKCPEFYDPADERWLLWSVGALGDEWSIQKAQPSISLKDAAGVRLAEAETFP
jgi:dTDP-4-dehydrorhamnose 3,5-epimerase